MKKQFNSIDKIRVWLIWPISINLLVSVVVLVMSNYLNAKSCFIGGLVSIIPHAVFGFCSFQYSGAQKSKLIWQSFVRGEAFKLALTAMMFAFVFNFLLINTLWFLLAFIMMQFIEFGLSCRLVNH